MHGARGGAPRGNRNALKHGEFTAEGFALKKQISALSRIARETLGGDQVAARPRARKKALEGATAPLDYLLGIMRDKDQDARSRLDAAKAAAPYCHARLSSTELSGPSGGPVTSQKLDISGLNDEELDILERALQRTVAVQEEC
jgi:hypothetical protein